MYKNASEAPTSVFRNQGYWWWRMSKTGDVYGPFPSREEARIHSRETKAKAAVEAASTAAKHKTAAH